MYLQASSFGKSSFFHLVILTIMHCLHLSEVLKQVWDLSDQDNDSMLSLMEFCIAVYLMERYREGCSLPAALPSNILFDLSSVLQSTTGYSSAAWRPSFGILFALVIILFFWMFIWF